MSTPFYVGYQKVAPAPLARRNRRFIVGFALTAIVATTWLALSQQPRAAGTFEFGTRRTFTGTLLEHPIPMLRVDPPAGVEGPGTTLVVVGFGKQGLPAFARGHHGDRVRFDGTLVVHGSATMVEMNDADSFAVLDPAPGGSTGAGWTDSGSAGARTAIELGPVRLTGELVDTKCWFGVMRPAAGKVHRACAIRCLSGGVPPGLLVRDGTGGGAVFLLAGAGEAPLDFDVEWAGLPITVVGSLELHDELPLVRVTEITPQR